MFLRFIISVIVIICSVGLHAQNDKKIDSLKTVIKSNVHDTIKINAIIQWDDLIYINDPDLDLQLNEQIVEISNRNLLKESLVKKEIWYYKSALVKAFNIIGINYDNLGNYFIALDYYYKSMSYGEEIDDKGSQGGLYNNIGLIHEKQNDFDLALDFYYKSLSFELSTGDSTGVATATNNIGNIHLAKESIDSALIYYKRSYSIAKKLNDIGKIGSVLENMGLAYGLLNMLDSSLIYFQLSVGYLEQIGEWDGLSNALFGLGKNYLKNDRPDLAIQVCRKGLKIASENDGLLREAYNCECLYKSYKLLGNLDSALYFHEKVDSIKEYLINSENTRAIAQKEMSYQHQKVLISDSIQRQNEIELSNAQLEKMQTENENANLRLVILLGGVVVLILFGFLIYRRLKIARKQQRIIEEQKREVEDQRDLIEEKNTEITDSINYAQRIQQALLKSEEHVTSHFPPHFILLKPKDIVSGDFYWAIEKQGYLYVSVADCTGHGVPGAFMSMLGIAFLNEINSVEEMLSPAQILDELRERIIRELSQTASLDDSRDGMDMCVLKMNIKMGEIEWAGANNPLYIISKEEVLEIPADRQPVAYSDYAKPFTNHILDVPSESCLYMFSDGFADQFGGPKGKKFKSKQYKELLLKIVKLNMEDQKSELNLAFESWRGDIEQIDDVCVIGVRI